MGRVAVIMLVALAVGTPIAHGATVTVTTTGGPLSWPPASGPMIEMTLTSGGSGREETRFLIERPWAEGWGAGTTGSPLSLGPPTVDAPGSMLAYVHGGIASSPTACLRGELTGYGGVQVDIPAGATTTVRWPVRLAARPWIGADTVARLDVRTESGKRVATVRTRKLPVTGTRGMRVVMRLAGKSIVGRTKPAVAGARVRLTAAPATERPSMALGTVTTDRDGAFVLPLKILPRDDYRIDARASAPANSGLASDTSCGLQIRVGRDGRVESIPG